jgi:hypothetical protein
MSSTQTHYPEDMSSTQTHYPEDMSSTQTHYPDVEPLSLCSYSLMLRAEKQQIP